jgi:ABC-type uncharacterized transport system permease subunit
MAFATMPALLTSGGGLLALLALVLYALAAWPSRWAPAVLERGSALALLLAWVLHLALLVMDIGGWDGAFAGQPGRTEPGMRLGFAPVLSMTVWLMIAVHTVESRFLPLPRVRTVLGVAGAVAVLLTVLFPGEAYKASSALAPLHFALGLGSYGLFAVAVLHAVLLDRAERRLRPAAGGAGLMTASAAASGTGQPNVSRLGAAAAATGAATAGQAFGLPLLQLERLTFRFVQAGFVALTATLVLGAATTTQWRFSHKLVLSFLAWSVFAALLAGRHYQGWRGRQATRWLYVGAVFLLLAYVGTRLVFEVLLGRPPV